MPSNPSAIPSFGKRLPHVTYTFRPGAYGLILNAARHLALVRTDAGIYLPGGGQETGESLEETVVREVKEETGLSVNPLYLVGVADQLVFSPGMKQYLAKRCTFFTCLDSGGTSAPSEPDHHLFWLPLNEAADKLTEGSQGWAVTEASRKGLLNNIVSGDIS